MKSKNVVSGVLTIASLIGVVATTYFCFHEAKDANDALDKEKAKREEEGNEEDMTMIEKAKIVAPKMVKTAVSGGITLVTIASGQFVHLAVVGGLAAAGGVWKDKYDDIDAYLAKEAPDLREKVHGAMAKVNLGKKLNEEAKKSNPVTKATDKAREALDKFNKAGEGEEPFMIYDDVSGQKFKTNKNRYIAAKMYLNELFASGGTVMYNDVLTRLGGKRDDKLNDKGWCICNEKQSEQCDENAKGVWVDMYLDTYHDPNSGKDILILRYSIDPLKIIVRPGDPEWYDDEEDY